MRARKEIIQDILKYPEGKAPPKLKRELAKRNKKAIRAGDYSHLGLMVYTYHRQLNRIARLN